MNAEHEITAILDELTQKPLNIQTVALVSADGSLLSTSVGVAHNNLLPMIKYIPYLAQSIREELQWKGIQKICIQGNHNYLILACCKADVFLMVYTHEIVFGLLDREINRTVEAFRGILQRHPFKMGTSIKQFTSQTSTPLNSKASPNTLIQERHSRKRRDLSEHLLGKPHQSKAQDLNPSIRVDLVGLNQDFIEQCEQNLAFCIGPIAPVILQKILAESQGKTQQQFIDALEQTIPDPGLAQTFRKLFV
ncbi:MAG: roadblock/LC7 domain-containing protein [Thermosynechococcaceae cyanobacterium]